MNRFLSLALITFVVAFSSTTTYAANNQSKVVSAQDIQWGYLNPLRGKLSPGAANLWGDRTTNTASGILVRFNQGFESPPHIHNVSYRGIVINGLVHNNEPKTEKMWLPKGSFWTQPAGDNHTTAAHGESNLIYLEIDSGPYLVKPTQEKFENGEQALNLHRDNMVWLDDKQLQHINVTGVESTFLWQNTLGVTGSMVKLPTGFNGTISSHASEFRIVLISGELTYRDQQQKVTNLTAGSYIESTGVFNHNIENKGPEEAILYIRANTNYRVN